MFNNVSEALLKETLLKKGEQVVYKVVGIQPDPMNPGKWSIPAAKNVPPTDQIWDEEKQEYIDIAAVKTFDAEGTRMMGQFGKKGGHHGGMRHGQHSGAQSAPAQQ